jgi:hypothetical protein
MKKMLMRWDGRQKNHILQCHITSDMKDMVIRNKKRQAGSQNKKMVQ